MRKYIAAMTVITPMLLFSPYANGDGFGIKGGVNFTDVSSIRVVDIPLDYYFGTKTGLIIGAFYRFDLGKRFAIQPEVYYSMKGTKASGEETIINMLLSYDIRVKLSYLEIPVLIKYKVPAKGKIKPTIFVGPFLGFIWDAKLVGREEFAGQQATVEIDIGDFLKGAVDLGITFGAGLDFDTGHGSIILDARCSLGLTYTFEDVYLYSKLWAGQARNSTFSLMLGYAFKGK